MTDLGLLNVLSKPKKWYARAALTLFIGALTGCVNYSVYVNPPKEVVGTQERVLEKSISQLNLPQLKILYQNKGFNVVSLDNHQVTLRLNTSSPELYVDCGRELRFDNKGAVSYDQRVSHGQTATEAIGKNNKRYVMQSLGTRITAKLNFTPKENSTLLHVIANYQVTRYLSVLEQGKLVETKQDKIDFNSDSSAKFEPSPWLMTYTCQATGALEKEILDTVASAN